MKDKVLILANLIQKIALWKTEFNRSDRIREHIMPLEKREYVCDCGNRMDRDRNSAINIMLRYLSQNGLWTAYRQFVGNLRQTGLAVASYSQEAITSTYS